MEKWPYKKIDRVGSGHDDGEIEMAPICQLSYPPITLYPQFTICPLPHIPIGP